MLHKLLAPFKSAEKKVKEKAVPKKAEKKEEVRCIPISVSNAGLDMFHTACS